MYKSIHLFIYSTARSTPASYARVSPRLGLGFRVKGLRLGLGLRVRVKG